VINKNYTELNSDLLEQFRIKDPTGDSLFELLFRLYKAGKNGRRIAEEKYQSEPYKNIFQRFWKEGKPDYRSLITILASSGCVGKNIYSENMTLPEMEQFIHSLDTILVNDEDRFIRYYRYAYEAIMTYLRFKNEGKTDKDIQRTMYDDLKSSDFNTLFDQICMIADGRESENNN
jgi:hypothetical protein